ncbi:MAG: hypothetical protein P4L98_24060 [Ancalomicrobiaceae bacterium]|nr:hypothetical protein [Ancalomicrobiaceae bacterium]
MRPGLPFSIALHAAVLGWALLSFAGEPPMDVPPSDPIDVELLPPSDVSTPKLGAKTAKPSEQIAPKDLKAAAKDQEGKRVGDTKIEEPPPPPPEVKPAPPVEPKPVPVAEQPKQEPPPPKPEVKPEPPKPVAKVEPAPAPPPPAPQQKPDLPKEAEKAKDINEGKPPEAKEPPKDVNALDKLIAEKAKEEAKKPDPKPSEKPAPPVKVATSAPAAAKPSPSPSTSKFPGEVSSIQNHVATGTQSSRTEQHASLGTPTGPNANVKLSQSEMEALIGLLRAQILKCWNPPIGAAEANIKVTVVFSLNQDGSLNGTPQPASEQPANSLGPALVSSATRAIRQCQPYTMPADKYAAWASNKIMFDPGNQ